MILFRVNPNYSKINPIVNIFATNPRWVGLDSSVDIATHNGLNGPGIETRWTSDFLHGVPPIFLYGEYRINFLGVKEPGRGVDHPPLYSSEVKEGVELYLYCLSVTFVTSK
jgi:hypothetical protein